ncbi:MAG: Ig-like domain-containing protein [Bacteroidota bacterium]
MRAKIYLFLIPILIHACVGVDYFDDPVGTLNIEQEPLGLMPGDDTLLHVTYEIAGKPVQVPIEWRSLQPHIATVDNTGLVRAIANGQATIIASYLTASDTVEITVESDPDAVANVQISAAKTTLLPQEKIQLDIVVRNINNEVLTDRPIQWFSENSSLATVSTNGEVTAHSAGVVGIHAKVEGVKSNSIDFTIGTTRSGDFVSSGGYKAVGHATLTYENNKLILEFDDNFETSYALGTYVYLANATNGAVVRSTGFEIAQITTDGAKTFDISALDPNIELFDYRYVIILCKPASVTFGYADMN